MTQRKWWNACIIRKILPTSSPLTAFAKTEKRIYNVTTASFISSAVFDALSPASLKLCKSGKTHYKNHAWSYMSIWYGLLHWNWTALVYWTTSASQTFFTNENVHQPISLATDSRKYIWSNPGKNLKSSSKSKVFDYFFPCLPWQLIKNDNRSRRIELTCATYFY